MQPIDPTALVIDAEGELALARAVLADLGVDCVHLSGAKQEPLPAPRRLLVTTGALAVDIGLARMRGAASPVTWMAWVPGHSKTQRARLRQAGFDLLVPENVHPSALLLLLRRAVFEGENTQRSTRVAVGESVVYATALRSYRGVLVDLSARGCRLLVDRIWPVGRKLSVRLPGPERGFRGPLTLRGKVVRVEPAARDGGTTEELCIALQFQPLAERERARVREILRERIAGPIACAAAGDETPTLGRLRPDETPGRYQREITAIFRDGTRTLLGRDLSAEGLRVEQDEKLSSGQSVRLALHGAAREEPFLVDARVERDPAGTGLFLRFVSVDADAQKRLASLVADLPRIHRLDETPTHTSVVAQLLGRR